MWLAQVASPAPSTNVIGLYALASAIIGAVGLIVVGWWNRPRRRRARWDERIDEQLDDHETRIQRLEDRPHRRRATP